MVHKSVALLDLDQSEFFYCVMKKQNEICSEIGRYYADLIELVVVLSRMTLVTPSFLVVYNDGSFCLHRLT